MSSRRDFLQQMTVAGNMLLFGMSHAHANNDARKGPNGLRILILGGTGYIGPHFVRAAVGRGHKVSVFNRGQSQSTLPEGVEHLIGDRNENLESIRDRHWDGVIDLAAYVPSWVRSLGEALNLRAKHYVFISSSAVYDREAIKGQIREESPLRAYVEGDTPYSVTSHSASNYGSLKALCEREAERQFPGRALILRPDYIVGPGDPQGYFAYWPARAERGGEMLVVGDASMPVQFIDVRDLAEFTIRMIERSGTGIFNTVGPAVPTSLGQLVNAARNLAPRSTSFTPVPTRWVESQKDSQIWAKVLFWSNYSRLASISPINIERAFAAGLSTTPINVTLADTLEWYKKQPPERQGGLLSRPASGRSRNVSISWADYLKREKGLLATWRDQQRIEPSASTEQ